MLGLEADPRPQFGTVPGPLGVVRAVDKLDG
jgi:hypothetical protein